MAKKTLFVSLFLLQPFDIIAEIKIRRECVVKRKKIPRKLRPYSDLKTGVIIEDNHLHDGANFAIAPDGRGNPIPTSLFHRKRIIFDEKSPVTIRDLTLTEKKARIREGDNVVYLLSEEDSDKISYWDFTNK